jgi:hypothetical protein
MEFCINFLSYLTENTVSVYYKGQFLKAALEYNWNLLTELQEMHKYTVCAIWRVLTVKPDGTQSYSWL